MPVYEFYCCDCHTIFNFLSRKMQVPTQVPCPKCGRNNLEKKVSRFAISKGLIESQNQKDPHDPFALLDESKMEQLMNEFAPSLHDSDESEDPRQMAKLMNRMFELAGTKPTGAMLEAMQRMQEGEDPDSIDEQIGDEIESQTDPFAHSELHHSRNLKNHLRKLLEAPNVDPELYELP